MRDTVTKSAAKASSIYDDQVIDAAYLHSCPNCYFIGPFAKRVSFASQQYRAIDLVEALHRKGKLTPDKAVAVIGAGLAGLTATAALRGLRCKKLHLYESIGPLHRQKTTRHRVVHPTISRWPMEPLSLTTKFPFLDWFAAPCDTIIECLMTDWNRNLSRTGAADNFDFKKGTRVDGFAFPPGPDEGRVRLKTQPSMDNELSQTLPPAGDELYDVVLVTTGFADETTVGDFKATSYWACDDIARWNTADVQEWRVSKRPILVSGCGDGGLIDCLRIIHGNFRDGWLAIELAEMLGPNFLGKNRIESAEHDALMAARSIACMPRKAPVPGGKGGAKAPDADFHEDAVRSEKYVNALAAAYHEVVEQLPAEVLKLLDDSIAAAGMPIERVQLVSKEPSPFVPYSAPIHKLMIAHALQKTRIRYESGQVKYIKGAAWVIRRDGCRPYKVPDALFIVRHGAPANMIGPIGADELASLKIRQLLMADYIDRDAERILNPPPDYPDRNVPEQQETFIAYRYGLAKALVRQIAPQMRLTADRDGFRYVRAEGDVDAPTLVRIPLPSKLFGVAAAHADLAYDIDHCLL
jgi:hypothetical protein